MKTTKFLTILLIALMLVGTAAAAETWIETEVAPGVTIKSDSSGDVADTTQSFNLYNGNGDPVTVRAHADDSGNYETVINCDHPASSGSSGGSGHRVGQATINENSIKKEETIRTVIEYVEVPGETKMVYVEAPLLPDHKCNHIVCIIIILILLCLLIATNLYWSRKNKKGRY
jgi:hypothetical protein